jgi:hypothetical protein
VIPASKKFVNWSLGTTVEINQPPFLALPWLRELPISPLDWIYTGPTSKPVYIDLWSVEVEMFWNITWD